MAGGRHRCPRMKFYMDNENERCNRIGVSASLLEENRHSSDVLQREIAIERNPEVLEILDNIFPLTVAQDSLKAEHFASRKEGQHLVSRMSAVKLVEKDVTEEAARHISDNDTHKKEESHASSCNGKDLKLEPEREKHIFSYENDQRDKQTSSILGFTESFKSVDMHINRYSATEVAVRPPSSSLCDNSAIAPSDEKSKATAGNGVTFINMPDCKTLNKANVFASENSGFISSIEPNSNPKDEPKVNSRPSIAANEKVALSTPSCSKRTREMHVPRCTPLRNGITFTSDESRKMGADISRKPAGDQQLPNSDSAVSTDGMCKGTLKAKPASKLPVVTSREVTSTRASSKHSRNRRRKWRTIERKVNQRYERLINESPYMTALATPLNDVPRYLQNHVDYKLRKLEERVEERLKALKLEYQDISPSDIAETNNERGEADVSTAVLLQNRPPTPRPPPPPPLTSRKRFNRPTRTPVLELMAKGSVLEDGLREIVIEILRTEKRALELKEKMRGLRRFPNLFYYLEWSRFVDQKLVILSYEYEIRQRLRKVVHDTNFPKAFDSKDQFRLLSLTILP